MTTTLAYLVPLSLMKRHTTLVRLSLAIREATLEVENNRLSKKGLSEANALVYFMPSLVLASYNMLAYSCLTIRIHPGA